MNDIRPATDLRDAARRRVRRATTMIAASSAVIAGVVAAYVAGAATGQKAVGSTTTPNTQRGEVPVPATPVAPSLDSSAQQQTPTPAQSAPGAAAEPVGQPAGRRVGRLVTATDSFPALGTTAVVAVTDETALPTAREVLEHELAAIDHACSRFRHDSELWSINRGAGAPIEVDPLCFEAVRVALDVAALTGGLVDPTVGANMRLAGYDRTFAEIGRRDGRRVHARFTGVAGWRSVATDRTSSTVSVPVGVELDLGATAKALAADRASQAAAEAADCGVLVCLGGDVAVAGPAPPGGWPIKIADDHASPLGVAGPVVAIVEGGLASSSSAVRRWTTAGGELHHILDPRTGRPARSHWRTVSAVAGSCVLANAATTAAVVLGEAAPAWLEEREVPARLVTIGGNVATVNGWPTEGP